MDLDGAGGYFRWTISGWSWVLKLAEQFGWEPTGTGPPRGVLKANWPGHYGSNDSQRVYARDARRMADALESALPTLPTEEAGSVRDFIAFCRAGSFRIR